MEKVAVFIGTVIGITIIIALLGWIASICVAVVFGTEFTFWQGVALVMLANIIFNDAMFRKGGDQS